MPPHICLNMIVRNESARIIRALDSCKGFISSFAILDTGSFDATPALIREWGITNGIPGIVGIGSFVNFSQARNDALKLARSWHDHKDAPWFDFLLLMDADMELVVKHPAAFANLDKEVYEAVQVAGGMSYDNIRLVHVLNTGTYTGVTHEFYNSPSQGKLANASFIDHADGSNRVDKFERDIRLLRADLENDPDNPRTWFYLANSERDAGHYIGAADAYRRRIALGGWDEEVWHAQVDLALVLLKQGLQDAFMKEIMAAYQLRPQRTEVLHYLGKYLREKGHQRAALLFIEKGLHSDRPDDKLFVPDWCYQWGFREEYSICAFYGDSVQRDRGYRVTNGLALDKTVPDHVRGLARSNMGFYLPKLDTFCPSFETREINFLPRRGYTAMNPSVCAKPNGRLEVLLRTVNYKIDEHGRYMIGETECNDAPIMTENWLLSVGDDLITQDYNMVMWERPAPKFDKVIGLEDMRIWWRGHRRMFSATVREQSAIGQCEQWYGYLTHHFGQNHVCVEDAMLMSDPAKTEKNWMPVVNHITGSFIYDLTKVYDLGHKQMFDIASVPLAVENIRGSSQLVHFKGGYLAVVHEAIYRGGKRVYQHRFAHFAGDLNSYRLSLPFVFEDVQIEFCAGLAPHPDGKSFVISYGVRDELAMLAKVNAEEIAFFVGATS